MHYVINKLTKEMLFVSICDKNIFLLRNKPKKLEMHIRIF